MHSYICENSLCYHSLNGGCKVGAAWLRVSLARLPAKQRFVMTWHLGPFSVITGWAGSLVTWSLPLPFRWESSQRCGFRRSRTAQGIRAFRCAAIVNGAASQLPPPPLPLLRHCGINKNCSMNIHGAFLGPLLSIRAPTTGLADSPFLQKKL